MYAKWIRLGVATVAAIAALSLMSFCIYRCILLSPGRQRTREAVLAPSCDDSQVVKDIDELIKSKVVGPIIYSIFGHVEISHSKDNAERICQCATTTDHGKISIKYQVALTPDKLSVIIKLPEQMSN